MNAGFQIGIVIGFSLVAAMVAFVVKTITNHERDMRQAEAEYRRMSQRILYEILMAERRKKEQDAKAKSAPEPVIDTTDVEAAAKIRRLLKLAQRPGTPAEGQVALQKAHALADKHGIRIRV